MVTDYTVLVRDITSLLVFLYASIYDWKSREIDPKVWIPAFIVGIGIDIYQVLKFHLNIIQVISILISLLFLGVIAVLTFILKHLGGADFLAATALIALYPYPMMRDYAFLGRYALLPPIIGVMVYYTIIVLTHLVYNTSSNLRYINELKKIPVSRYKKILFFIVARVMTIEKFKKSKFYFPVYVPNIVDRISFDVYEDDRFWKEKLSVLEDSTIIITLWGIPTVTFIGISLVIYILVGCSPLDVMLYRMLT